MRIDNSGLPARTLARVLGSATLAENKVKKGAWDERPQAPELNVCSASVFGAQSPGPPVPLSTLLHELIKRWPVLHSQPNARFLLFALGHLKLYGVWGIYGSLGLSATKTLMSIRNVAFCSTNAVKRKKETRRWPASRLFVTPNTATVP